MEFIFRLNRIFHETFFATDFKHRFTFKYFYITGKWTGSLGMLIPILHADSLQGRSIGLQNKSIKSYHLACPHKFVDYSRGKTIKRRNALRARRDFN